MTDIKDGESVEMQGSGKKPYILKNTGGVYSCSCPAWRNQSSPIERRTCKHLIKLRGQDVETKRLTDGVVAAVVAGRAAMQSSTVIPPPLLLAHSWTDEDPTGWWMSEKMDGVRAYWDGENFISRLGNVYHAPAWFKKGLGTEPLDGELFVGRGQFQQTVSVVRRQDMSDDWEHVRYVVFDAPKVPGTFEERLEYLKQHCNIWTRHKLCGQEKCQGVEHLKEALAKMNKAGGEGLMLRKPGSLYEAGRSTTLLKVKTFYDAEATVVGHSPGKGRHKGRLGALECKMPDGTLFSVGSGLSDKERDNPPAIGAVITYHYQELTKDGVPRFPTYMRERTDL